MSNWSTKQKVVLALLSNAFNLKLEEQLIDFH